MPLKPRSSDHGVYGTLFPVAEQDLREVFKSRLKHLTDTGRMQQLETEFRAKAESAATWLKWEQWGNQVEEYVPDWPTYTHASQATPGEI